MEWVYGLCLRWYLLPIDIRFGLFWEGDEIYFRKFTISWNILLKFEENRIIRKMSKENSSSSTGISAISLLGGGVCSFEVV